MLSGICGPVLVGLASLPLIEASRGRCGGTRQFSANQDRQEEPLTESLAPDPRGDRVLRLGGSEARATRARNGGNSRVRGAHSTSDSIAAFVW